MPQVKTTFIDMDGVLVDWIGGAASLFGKDRNEVFQHSSVRHDRIHEAFGIDSVTFRDKLNSAGSDFWANLELLPWAEELLSVAGTNSRICILSSPSSSDVNGSVDGKIRWLRNYFGSSFRSYLLGGEKFHSAHPNAVLIDDYEHNTDLFKEHGGHVILVPQPWNSRRHLLREDGLHLLDELRSFYRS